MNTHIFGRHTRPNSNKVTRSHLHSYVREIFHRQHSYKDFTQPFNLGLGFILFATGILLFLGIETLGLVISKVHAFVLVISGIFSLWAGYSKNNNIVYAINLALGLLFILSCVAAGLFGSPVKYINVFTPADTMTLAVPGIFRLGGREIILHGMTGVIFLFNTWVWKRRHLNDKSREDQFIEDFGP